MARAAATASRVRTSPIRNRQTIQAAVPYPRYFTFNGSTKNSRSSKSGNSQAKAKNRLAFKYTLGTTPGAGQSPAAAVSSAPPR